MPQPLVSIIVPIYKVEPYLRRCLDSIANQTYTNLEIILVDDGSPDNCPQICDEYAAKDKRIVVIHKENGGLSDARNAGLNICKGEYISFVDSDDWVDKRYIEILLDLAIKENADITVGSCQCIAKDYSKTIISNFVEGEPIIYPDILQEIFEKFNPSFVAAWCKLFHKQIIQQFRFPIGKIHEDEYLNYRWFFLSKKTTYAPNAIYTYFIHSDSITGRNSKYDKIEILNLQKIFFEKNNINIAFKWIIPSLCWEHLWEYGQSTLKKDFTKASIHLSLFRSFAHKARSISQITLKTKIIFLFFAKYPLTYILYRKYAPFKLRK